MNQSIHVDSKEKGGALLLFAIFLFLAIPLFVYAVDGYFMLQSRLDQQNAGEYLSLAALSGFYDSPTETDFSIRRQEAINAIAQIANDNGILGLGSSSTSWSFTSNGCSNATCQGSGWSLKFGTWNGSSFTLAPLVFPGVPDSIDPSSVNAVLLELEIRSSGNLIKFFANALSSSPAITISSLANSYEVGASRYYKLIKNNASGKAI